MRKIPTVFVRDADDRKHVTSEVTPGCEWVLAGEGVATRKYDGTCCLLVERESIMSVMSLWWARREVKNGKAAPDNFVAVNYDEATDKTVGWEPIAQSGFAQWHADALGMRFDPGEPWETGTYELCGPKINGNPDKFAVHVLVAHGTAMVLRSILDLSTPSEVMSFARWAGEEGYEGIVWHHPDGRMAKLKARDIPAAP